MNTPAKIETYEMLIPKEIRDFLNLPSVLNVNYIIPAIYDNMENINNIKISERFPKFGFGDLLDDILKDFGGVLEIFKCEWDEIGMEGELVCLLNDWRVFRYVLKQNELASLDGEGRIKLINKDCLIFEDIDDWSAWKELDGDRWTKSKKEIEEKKEIEKQKQSAQEYISDLEDFFSGNIEKMQKMMQCNKGV